jgi:aldose 1-epimerase
VPPVQCRPVVPLRTVPSRAVPLSTVPLSTVRLMRNPTGEQYEITFGDQRAVVTEVGAALRVYAVGGRDVLLGFAADEVIKGGRGQQLIPWPNRVRDGRYTFAGVTQQLALTEPARHNASHGLARHVAWTLLDHSEDSVSMQVRIFPQPGWPGILGAELTYALEEGGLTVSLSATNLGVGDIPFGYGAHPYLTAGEQNVDELTITVPASSYLEVDDRLLPRAVSPVADTSNDLRTAQLVGARTFDTAFTDVSTDDNGRWQVRLELGERYAELWADDHFPWLQVYTGDAQRNIGVAVEPMSCGPDAFNPGPTHDALVVLGPGESFTGQWGIRGA